MPLFGTIDTIDIRWLLAGLFCFLDNLDQPPALCLADGTGLHDLHHIAGTGLALLIMRMELRRLLYELTVDGMLYLSFNGNGNGFGHFVAADHPGLSLA